MNTFKKVCRALPVAALALLGPARGFGQTTTVGPDSEPEDEVVILSPFTIDAAEDDGWVAGSTLVGSRTRESLRNVPISVDAITSDFMEDMGIQTLEDAGAFIAGLDTVPDDERDNDDGGTAFRGLSQGGRENAAASRNFFLWYPRTDSYNVGRIDFNKGSNSLMYGDASPGGIATVYTKQARFRNFGSVTGQYGSYDSYRMMLDINRQLNDRIALRLNAVQRNNRSYIDFAEDYLEGVDLAGTVNIFDNLTLRFEAEDLSYERTRANSRVEANQRAADGRGFSSTTSNYFTSDGEYVDSRDRLVYSSDGMGGFGTPYTLSADDRRRGATGDDLSWAVGMTPEILTYDGDPFITLPTIPRGVNTTGVRDFIARDINNYTLWLESRLGDLNVEFAVNRQEQYQLRNDNRFGYAVSADNTGRLYLDSDLDRKTYGNNVDTVRLTATYPLEFGRNFKQYLVANVTYLDDEAFSFRERLVNKAKAYDSATGEYDVLHDLEGRDRIRVRGYFDASDPVAALSNADQWTSLTPEALPVVPGIFEPMWVHYTTSNKPFTDKRYSKSGSFSASGSYFGGKLRSLVGVRYDQFKLKRYQLPEGTAQELVDEYGELAWWGQDVYVGSPDQAPEYYAYVPELDQSATTGNAGLVYQLNRNLNVYGNYSSSFRWQGTEDFLGRNLGPQDGVTREIGLKGELFENRLGFSMAAFEVDRDNVAYTFSTSNSAEELELLFNDVAIDIQNGSLIYTPATPGSAGFVEIPRGLNNEHRQITASETSKGLELTLQLKRIHGLQARLALSHIDVTSDRDVRDYAEQVVLAEARLAERQAIIDQYWPSDPNYAPGTLPEMEADLRDYLEDARNVVASNSTGELVTGSRSRPYMASWILDYQMSDGFILPGLRIILSGRYADNYLMSTNDGVNWYGGSTHPVDLSFHYRTKLFNRRLDLRLKIDDLHDFENTDFKEFSGFVDQYSGEQRLRWANIRPTSWTFSATYHF
ncbi:TonB-dependent siderophore receptor [Actomonas aquatica]|uniref:TonB-dependent receptor n=1 Tax=Actomonas aquatica TaxID=2866162 RepID=A0ABZ1C633_9BACT|nr:TonB-dependent receptor [Opitutus sp. WL0086]WRQ86723.1 TonB-dependent receptor [Opitutus sp. WL0086]